MAPDELYDIVGELDAANNELLDVLRLRDLNEGRALVIRATIAVERMASRLWEGKLRVLGTSPERTMPDGRPLPPLEAYEE